MSAATFFDAAYLGVPPWDIGRPQGVFVRLAQEHEIGGDVLDVGCGTGENALHLAELGHEVWGVDIAPRAIERAKAKAKDRKIKATFLVWDALELQKLGRTFDTVIDCGLFHGLSDRGREQFVEGLGTVLGQGGTYYMLCFSDSEPGTWGPRRVAQAEIRDAFGKGWRVNYIRESRFENSIETKGARAWLASITRL